MRIVLLLFALLALAAPARADVASFQVHTVSSSSAEAVPANRARLWLRLSNAGGNPLTCTPGGTATATTGYVLAASGGSVEFAHPESAARSYHCISASGSTLVWDEVTKDGSLSPTPTPTPSPTPTPAPTPTE